MYRRTVVLILAAAAAWCGLAAAQEKTDHTIQAGLGVSYARSSRVSSQYGFGGLVAAGSVAQNRHLRWAWDFDIEFAGSPFQAVPPQGIPASAMARIDQLLMEFHGGPELTKHAGRVSLFVHGLPGYTSWSLGALAGESWADSAREGGFSLAAGGGVDIHVKENFDIRFQADYIPAWHGQGAVQANLVPAVPPGKSPYGNLRVAMVFLAAAHRPQR